MWSLIRAKEEGIPFYTHITGSFFLRSKVKGGRGRRTELRYPAHSVVCCVIWTHTDQQIHSCGSYVTTKVSTGWFSGASLVGNGVYKCNRTSARALLPFIVLSKTNKQKPHKYLSVCKCNPFAVTVSQVYRCMAGNDYLVKKEGAEARRGRSRKIGTAVD